jgi:hypothetical protein
MVPKYIGEAFNREAFAARYVVKESVLPWIAENIEGPTTHYDQLMGTVRFKDEADAILCYMRFK